MAFDEPLRRLPVWLLALLVGVVALLPRTLGLTDFFTEDESFHWVWRVQHFAGAIRQENWADTNLTGHPGVTTMWLGTLGRWLALTLGIPTEGLAEGSASIAYLAWLRLPLALVNGLAVVAGYLLLCGVVRPMVALVAALLWATSPFLIAHSRLLHLDVLLTSFMILSILCVIRAGPYLARSSMGTGAVWAVPAAGGLSGLAFLTKAPSIVLLPAVGLVLLLVSPPAHLLARLRWVSVRYVLWLVCAALVVVAGWPAMWVAPQAAVTAVLNEIASNGAVPHHTGNYFLGEPVADPGPLFYPAVALWRSTPVLLVGLLLLPLAWYAARHDRHPDERRALLALSIFVALFVLALSGAPKKFDRYLLPIWPALCVLAAYGLVFVGERLRAAARRFSPTRHDSAALLAVPAWALLALVLAGNLLWYHPYYLAYFNPLLGGGATAQRVMLVGWGEGMEQVGAWLRTRPDLTRSPVLTWGPRTLEPFVPGRTAFLNSQHVSEPASYAVLYSRSVQRQESWEAQEYVRQSPPLYTLRRYGIDYASVHQPPVPYSEPLDVVFGEGLHLRGFSQDYLGHTLVITPSWNIQADQPGGLFSFVHVLAPDGRRVAQVDVPIDAGLFEQWQAGQQFGGPLPIPLPADLPAGEYLVILGVFDPTSSTRLPPAPDTPPDLRADGDAVLMTTFRHDPTQAPD